MNKEFKQGLELVSAAFKGRVDRVKQLLDEGVDVNGRGEEQETALMFADVPGILKMLLERGADVNAHDRDGMTALMFAAAAGNMDKAQLLLDHGADISLRDDEGCNAIMHAAAIPIVGMVDFLSQKMVEQAEKKIYDRIDALNQKIDESTKMPAPPIGQSGGIVGSGIAAGLLTKHEEKVEKKHQGKGRVEI